MNIKTLTSIVMVFFLVVPVDTEGSPVAEITPKPVTRPNVDFLDQEPRRKLKKRVCRDAIQTQSQADQLKFSLNSIMSFLGAISYLDHAHEEVQRTVRPQFDATITENGRKVLRLPPLNKKPIFVGERRTYGEFHLLEFPTPKEIHLVVDFRELLGSYGYYDKFVFVLEGDNWKFDRHGWPKPKWYPLQLSGCLRVDPTTFSDWDDSFSRAL